MTPKDIERAKEMRKSGFSWSVIADEVGFSRDTVRCAIDEEYAKYRRARINAARRARAEAHKVEVPREVPSLNTRRDAEVRLREIPRDTRDLTATIFGDPIYERSSLYRKMGAE